MAITVSKDEVRVFEKLKSISYMAPLKEKIRFFEEKYGCTFEEFEDQLKAKPEDFERWDDYLEWQAYRASLQDLEEKLRAIEDAQDVRIT
jgi:molybdopterin converting factor small subunit